MTHKIRANLADKVKHPNSPLAAPMHWTVNQKVVPMLKLPVQSPPSSPKSFNYPLQSPVSSEKSSINEPISPNQHQSKSSPGSQTIPWTMRLLESHHITPCHIAPLHATPYCTTSHHSTSHHSSYNTFVSRHHATTPHIVSLGIINRHRLNLVVNKSRSTGTLGLVVESCNPACT